MKNATTETLVSESIPINKEYEYNYTTDKRSTENSTNTFSNYLDHPHPEFNSEANLKISNFQNCFENNFESNDSNSEQSTDFKSEGSIDFKSEESTDFKSEEITDSKSEESTDSKSEESTDSKFEENTYSKSEEFTKSKQNNESSIKNMIKQELTNSMLSNTNSMLSKSTHKLSLSTNFPKEMNSIYSTNISAIKLYINYIFESARNSWPILLTAFPCISFLTVPLIAYGTIFFLAMLPIISIAICLIIAFLPVFWKRIEPKFKFFKPSIGTVLAFSLIVTPFSISLCIPICFFSPLILLFVTPWILLLVPAVMIFLLPFLFGITFLIGILLVVFHYSLPKKIESHIREVRSWIMFKA